MLLVALAMVGFSGCGGSDSEPAPAPAPTTEPVSLSKADLISEGDAICAEVNAAIGALQASTTTAESDKAEQVAGFYRSLAERLEKLGTPDDGPAPEEVIAALNDLADPASGSTDPATFQEAAGAYGFTDCADGPSAPVSTGSDTGTVPSETPDAGSTYEAPAPETTPAPAPAPAPDTGGVTPDAPDTGGAAPPAGGSGGSSGGSGTGGIGPG